MPVISMPNPGDAAAGAIGSFLTANTQQQNVQAQLAAAAAAQQFNQQMQTDKFSNLKDQQAQQQQHWGQDFGLRQSATNSNISVQDMQTKVAAYTLEEQQRTQPIRDRLQQAQLAYQQGNLSTQALDQAHQRAMNEAQNLQNGLTQKYGAAVQQAALATAAAQQTASYASANNANANAAYTSQQAAYLPQQAADAHAASAAGTQHMNSLTAINNGAGQGPVDPIIGSDTGPLMKEFQAQAKMYGQKVSLNQQAANRGGTPQFDPKTLAEPMSPLNYSATVQNAMDQIKGNPSLLQQHLQAIQSSPALGPYAKRNAMLLLTAAAQQAQKTLNAQPQTPIQGLNLPGGGNTIGSFGQPQTQQSPFAASFNR